MGRQSDLFNSMHVCDSFKAKVLYNQLCYEVDVHEILSKDTFPLSELKLGLSLLIDTNFNRQYSLKKKVNKATLTETIGKKQPHLLIHGIIFLMSVNIFQLKNM